MALDQHTQIRRSLACRRRRGTLVSQILPCAETAPGPGQYHTTHFRVCSSRLQGGFQRTVHVLRETVERLRTVERDDAYAVLALLEHHRFTGWIRGWARFWHDRAFYNVVPGWLLSLMPVKIQQISLTDRSVNNILALRC